MTGEKPLKILHVDDEENQLEFTKIFLEQFEDDVIVDSVKDPEEALKKQEEENYDCIVSDYKMMSMNGIELAQKVREKSDIPFILYTGQGSEDVAETAFSAGVDDYLRKEAEPTHYQVLAKRIKHTVEKHRTEELYRKVVEESRDAIVIIVKNKIAFLNQAACELIGVKDNEECVGKDVIEIFEDESEKITSPKLDENSNSIISANYRTQTGELKISEISLSKINYRGDEAYLCFIRDITERKRNEERLNAIYKQATRLGSSLTIQEISDVTLDIMEAFFNHHILTFHILEGNTLVTLGTRGAPTVELSLPLVGPGITTKAARDGQSVLVSDVSTCSDYVRGTTDSNSELAVPAILNGETLAVLNVESKNKNDFSEADVILLEMLAYHVSFAFNRIQTQKLKEREKEEKRKRLDYALGVLENAERANTLLNGELQRNILSILNAAGMLRIKPDILPEVINAIDERADKAQKVSELIKETINKSTKITGFIEINQSVRMLLEKIRIPKNIRVNIQYDKGLLLVEIEEEKFIRILTNIIVNAVEVMPRGGILSIKVTAGEEKVNVDIGDTGPGISDNVKDTLFKPFKSTKDGHSGLGLAFSKNVAETAGGSLSLRYTSEKGTTFRLTLPLRKIN